ncbi:MAG: GTP-binding protein [Bacteroidales bacterium]|nr:GTP-binding protein [Bacteroidales bacterium]
MVKKGTQTPTIKNDLSQARKLIKECQKTQNSYLDLGKCGITNLNDLPELFECIHLEILILANIWWNFEENKVSQSSNTGTKNNFETIPSKITNLKNLKKFYMSSLLSGWGISDISFLENLTELQTLDFSYNKISDYSFLEYPTGLKTLYLGHNEISDIRFLKNLTRLETLSLHDNKISDIRFLKNLTRLETLSLRLNKISDIRFLENLTGLETLVLRNNKISNIRFLKNLTRLEKLVLGDNKISNIRFLKNLTRLKTLDLSLNKISDIRFLENLTGLETLDLSFNKISDYSFLENLVGLQTLNLRANQISDYSFLENLVGLQILNLSANKISDISFLENLIGLETLDLSNNKISDICFLENFICLKKLNLSSNNLKKIPVFIFQLEMEINLDKYGGEGLCLYDNPIESPPMEILKQGRQSVLDWFEATKQKLDEIKVILIGEPKAGKTSLLRRLKLDTFDKDEVQTDGVNIEDIEFGECDTFQEQKSLHKLTGHFWDFGGQEIMNATHQFFLTKRSVYILVLDARKDANVSIQIRQWVKRIKATGGNSSIIIVANQIDVNSGFGFENEYELQKEFPQIKYFIKASCSTKKNIDLLKEKLEEFIPKAELFDTDIDERWISIKEKLQEETKAGYFLDETKFLNICKEFKLNDKSAQKNAITFLHDLGLVLHFEEVESYDYYVLDPYWITYGVYQILTSAYAGDKKGIVSIDKLDFIINEEEDKKEIYRTANSEKIQYTNNQRRFLVDILCQFKLCFYLPKRKQFIIPDLLDTNEPMVITEPIRDSKDCIRFVYEYDYLPKSTMPRILVEMHCFHKEIWRTGCVLVYDGCHALITNYRNRIFIIVTGEHKKKREFMAIIRNLINLINEKLSDKPRMLIPLPDVEAFVDYEELLEREKDGEKNYTIYKPIKTKFQISELLEGVSSQDEVLKIVKELKGEIDNVSCGIEELKCDHETILDNQEEIKKKLKSHSEYLINLLDNSKITDASILEAIKEINAKQTAEIIGDIMQWIATAFEHFDGDMDDKLKEIYTDLKKTDNFQMKLKLSVPFINLLGINLETEFDVKNWASQMYKKHKLKIFKLMGLL